VTVISDRHKTVTPAKILELFCIAKFVIKMTRDIVSSLIHDTHT